MTCTWPCASWLHDDGEQPEPFASAATTQVHVGVAAHAAGVGAHAKTSDAPPSSVGTPDDVSVQISPLRHVLSPHAKVAGHAPHVHCCVDASHAGAPHAQRGGGAVHTSHDGVRGGHVQRPPVQRARGPNGQSHGHRSPRVPSMQGPPPELLPPEDEVDPPLDEPPEDDEDEELEPPELPEEDEPPEPPEEDEPPLDEPPLDEPPPDEPPRSGLTAPPQATTRRVARPKARGILGSTPID